MSCLFWNRIFPFLSVQADLIQVIPVHRTQDGQAEEAFIKGIARQASNGFFLHLINPFEDHSHRKVGLEVDFILCQAGHQIVRALKAEEKISLQLFLGGFQFSILKGSSLRRLNSLRTSSMTS